MISVADLTEDILSVLNKSSSYYGFFEPAKVQKAIEDSCDWMDTIMMQANQGIFLNIIYLAGAQGQIEVPIPNDLSMIKAVRILIGNVYRKLDYNDQTQYSVTDPSGGWQGWPFTYRLKGQNLHFNPPLIEGNVRLFELEYLAYPSSFTGGGTFLAPRYDKACQQYLKWRSCSLLAAGIGKQRINVEWKQYEEQFFQMMVTLINQKNNVPTTIKDWDY